MNDYQYSPKVCVNSLYLKLVSDEILMNHTCKNVTSRVYYTTQIKKTEIKSKSKFTLECVAKDKLQMTVIKILLKHLC